MGRISGFILDIDGSVARGRQAIPGVPETLLDLRARGLRLAFCTQESADTPDEVSERLGRAGIAAVPGEIVTAAVVAAEYVRRQLPGARVFVVGAQGLLDALQCRGVTVVALEQAHTADVLLMGRDPEFDYTKLNAACQAVWRGARFLVTNLDRALPVENGLVPCVGAFAQAVIFATRRRPLVLGKPSRWAAQTALGVLGLPPTEVAVVGDRVRQDIQLGKNAGCQTVLVLSGGTTPADLRRIPDRLRPDAVLPDATHLPAWLEGRSQGADQPAHTPA